MGLNIFSTKRCNNVDSSSFLGVSTEKENSRVDEKRKIYFSFGVGCVRFVAGSVDDRSEDDTRF